MHNTDKSTKNTEDIYQKIRDTFDIRDLLTTKNPIRKELEIKNVIYDKSTNSTGSKGEQYYISEENKGKQRIIIYQNDKEGNTYKTPRYSNETYIKDKGDLYQFLKNRVENKSDYNVHKLLEKHDFFNKAKEWKKAIDVEHVYTKKTSKKTAPFKIEDYSNLEPITATIESEEPHYLNGRGISNDILLDPAFVDKVYVYDYTDDYGKTHQNIFFPKLENGEIKGAEVKTPYNKGYCFGKDKLLWFSNKPDMVKKVVIVESAINAISHKQLDTYSNKNTWYFSTNGNFYEARIDTLFKELEKEGIDKNEVLMSLATDNDYDGLKYDLAFINRMTEEKDRFHMDSYDGKPSISFETFDHSKKAEIHKFFIQVNNALNKTYRLARENKFITIEGEKNKLHLVFPGKEKIKRVAGAFSRSLIKNVSFVSMHKIKTDKSKMGNDWNDELKNKMGIKIKRKPEELKKKVAYKIKR
ncbi:hypothetical protein HN014_22445 (plasmid) [Aquimarina sp. TRL1]|uniref:toprim domain-containing protein n=1 Tax=Aquimarina sp. (strain TRL1) TaxID=2736252 RepID=UPI00158AD417|nr:toprim domain-containing protein [Aquimarina sp. TRL1]QKX07762.1 hypothetical protein HN014_22445 [Aquimarina sp. TRL1]